MATSTAKIIVSAEDQTGRVLERVKSNLNDVSSLATRVGTSLGLMGSVSVVGMAALAKSAIDGVDALNDVKDATGASIENISALEDVALRTGTGMDTVTTALVKFNGVLKDAKPGSAQEQVLKAIGLSAQELRDIDPAQALLLTAQALSGFADDGNKARITQELFGKSLKDVAPFLKDLAEQSQLVAKVTTDAAQGAEDFNKQLFKLQAFAVEVARSITGPLVNAINASIAKFREGAKEGKGFYTVMREEQLRLLGMNDGPSEYAAQLAEVNAQLAKGDTRVLVRSALLRKQAELQEKLNKLGVAEGGSVKPEAVDVRPSAPVVKAASGGGGKVVQTRDKGQEERMRLGRQASIADGQAVQDANDAYFKGQIERAKSTDSYNLSLQKMLQTEESSLQKMRLEAEEIGLTTTQLDALRLSRLDATIAQEQATASLMASSGATEQELEAMRQRIDLLRQQRDVTKSTQVATAAAAGRKETEAEAKKYTDTLQSDLKGAFSAAFRDTQDPIGAFGDALGNVVYTRVATSLAEALATEALGSVGKSSGGDSGLMASITSVLGFAKGGIMSSTGALKLNAYANGGVANTPQLALFGEGRMNEAYVPLPDGRTIPVTMSGGGAPQITVNLIESPGNGGKVSQRSEGGVNVLSLYVEQIKGSIASDISSGSGAVPAAMSATYGLNRVAGAY